MTTLEEAIEAFEYRKHVADKKIENRYHVDKFVIVSAIYEEVLKDLRRVK
jgi:hypothetical protein